MTNEDINLIIGQNLQKLRRSKKLTQLELAEKFNYSDKSISKWEKGESLPSIDILFQLASFYGVTLDDLTQKNDSLCAKEETKVPIRDRLFPTKLIISLLAVCTVWIAATIWYVSNKIVSGGNLYMLFLWSVPTSFIVLIVFNSIWGKRQWLFWILSFLLWSTLVCLHVQLIQYNVWIIYFVGIPLQIAFILWGALLRKPKKEHLKEKKKKAEKHKKLKNGKEVENTMKTQEESTSTTAPVQEKQEKSETISVSLK